MRATNDYENEDDMDWKGTLLDRGNPNMRRRPSSSYQAEPKSRLFAIGIAIGVIAICVTLYVMISGHGSNGEMPTIKADSTPYKTKPDQPGGADIPFQDKLVFNRLDPNGQPVQAEKLLPGAEEPMADKPAAATQPAAQPAPAIPPAVVTAPPAATTTTTTTTTATAEPVAAPVATPTPVAAAPEPVAAPAPVAAPVVEAKPAPVAAAPVVTPAPTPVAKTVTTTVAPAPKVAATPAPAPALIATTSTTPAGQVRVQLASIPNPANAQKALADMKAKYGSSLGSAGLTIVKADLPGKGTYYRLQSNPVDSATASRICASIKAQGGTCITAH